MIRLKKNVLFIFVLTVLAIFFISCEGPAGPAGEDGADGNNGTNGTDGVDGNVTCLVCHSDENLTLKMNEFARSSHKVGLVDAERGGSWSAGCVKCHTSEGFIEFAETGSNNGGIPAGDNAFECRTCHGIHTTFEAQDYALRTSDATWDVDDTPFLLKDMNMFGIHGNSTICANCHQSRRAEPNVDVPGATFNITSTHYGPHHGAQANVLAGFGFAEIPGTVAYPAAGSADHLAASCTGCHLYEGSHTFMPSLASCNECHATTSFDYGGIQTEVEDLFEELRDLLVAAGVLEYVDADEAYEPVVGVHNMVLARAFFNWVGLEEDRSMGAHNPKYVKALLKNSIAAVEAL